MPGKTFQRTLMLALVAISTTPARAADYYVNATGANGAFTTVQAAVNAVTGQSESNRARILIAPGTYTERITINKPNITLIGQGANPSAVMLTWNLTGIANESTTIGTSATGFIASNITFANSTPDNVAQALAIRSRADRAAFDRCRFIGYQDTILVDNSSRQYFRDCYVTGDVDFIFGNATAVFDRCTVNSTSGGYVTAAETSKNIANGLIFLDCTLTAQGAPGAGSNSVYLGRPWHYDDPSKMPSTLFIRTKMGPHIRAVGWSPWDAALNTNPDATTRYSEFASMDLAGSPLDVSGRVAWADAMTASQAASYTLSNIFGPATYWTATTQPEVSGVTYISQGAPWDPVAQLATVPEPSAAVVFPALMIFMRRRK